MLPCNLGLAEKRVLNLVSQAKPNKEIAAILNISPATVKRHLENILRKLRLKNRVEAAIYGLITTGCPRGVDSQCPLELWRDIVLKENRRLAARRQARRESNRPLHPRS